MPVFTINPIISKVLFPVFSKIKDNAAKINSFYSKALKLLMSINVPLHIGIIIVASDFILFYTGPEWAPAIPILRIVAFTILFTSVGNPGNTVLQAKGRADLGFYYGIIRALTIAIFILCAFYIRNTLISIAIAILINRYTIGFIWHYFIIKFGGIEYSSIINDFFRYALFSLVMTLVIFIFNSLFITELVTLRLFINIFLGVIVYALLIVFFDHDLKLLLTDFIKFKKR
jgi:O-antigen/teichoic acid export membrane protein